MIDEDLVNRLIGTPFLWGGRDPGIGIDCWGVVRLLIPCAPEYSGYDAPGAAASMARDVALWRPVPLDALRPGDGLLMLRTRPPHHAGVVTAGGVVHATRGLGVVRQPLALLRQVYPRMRGYRWPG